MYPETMSFRSSDRAGPESSFPERIARLLSRIDCRRADTDDEREAIYRLRYEAYLREGAIPQSASKRFSDRYDEMPHAYLFGLYIDGELASSIRIHVASKDHPDCLSLEAFPDILQPEIDAGKVIIDSTRFVSDKHLSQFHRGLPYATLRLTMVAAEHFHADLVLAAVRVGHQAFYRRAVKMQLICGPRSYPNLTKPLCLMASHYQTVVAEVRREYPFIASTFFERQKLFGREPACSEQQPCKQQGKARRFG